MTQSELSFTNEADPQLTTQCARLLQALRTYGKLTSADIWQRCAIWNGKGRIFDLRGAGYSIETSWHKGENRFGEPFRCAVYTIHEPKEAKMVSAMEEITDDK